MRPGGPNKVGNDLMVENKELHNKLAMREVSHAESVQQMISAESLFRRHQDHNGTTQVQS